MQDQAEAPATDGTTVIAEGSGSVDILNIPVWLHATESFYNKLNRIAKQCGLSRYEACAGDWMHCFANTKSKRRR
jgi:hypothetical protein